MSEFLPARKPYPLSLKISALVLGGCCALGVGNGISQPEEVRDLLYGHSGQTTATEDTIKMGLERSFGQKVVVRCLPPERLETKDTAKWITQGEAPRFKLLFVSEGIIRLRSSVCEDIQTFVDGPQQATIVEANALAVATHEMSHVINKSSEAETECYGVQRIEKFAASLGATPKQARTIANLVATERATLPPEYETPAGCIDGGRYDLDPTAIGVFPNNPVETIDS